MKKIAYLFLFFLLSARAASAFSGALHLDFYTQYSCGQYVLFVNDTDHVNADSIFMNLTISFIDSSTTADLTPSVINTSAGYPVYTYNNIRLSDTTFFDYLGSEVLDTSDVAHSKYHAYRFVFKSYPSYTNTITFFNLKIKLPQLPDGVYKWANFYYKNCGTCLRYPSRLELALFIPDILWNDQANEFGGIDLSLYPGYKTTYDSMAVLQQANVADLLNWILDYNAVKASYDSAFYVQNDSLSLPYTFYTAGTVKPSLNCPCKSDFVNIFHYVKEYVLANGDSTNSINYLKRILRLPGFYGCDCLGNYYIFLKKKGKFLFVTCEPIYSGLPYMEYVLWTDAGAAYETIVYSYEFGDNGGTQRWPHLPFADPVSFNTTTHVYTLADSAFTTFHVATDFQSACAPECVDCIQSFAPIPGKKYLISAWVKESGAALTRASYTYPQIIVSCPSASFTSSAFTAEGRIIDGWQRIEKTFTIPDTATDLEIRLACSSGDCFFDDIRILPFDGSLKSYVYDPVSMKLTAELDERNYATLYEYDEEGKLVRVKKETEKGVMTIQENRNKTKKK